MTTKEQVKTLWKQCFNDSEAFVDMYFSLRYKSRLNHIVTSGGKVVAALQTLPYPMSFCGERVNTSYVSGACTHPAFRGRGAMTRLLVRSFAWMLQEGSLFSTLIPAEQWLFDYYARMGYAPVFHHSVREIILPEVVPCPTTVELVASYREDACRYLNRKLSERNGCILHPADDFKVIMTDLALSNGHLLLSAQHGTTDGMAIFYKRGGTVLVGELLADSPAVGNDLLHAICQHTHRTHLTLLLPPDDTLPTRPLGMARIINAHSVLQRYARTFPTDERQFVLCDEQLPANNGHYRLHNGECQRTDAPTCTGVPVMTIGELTQSMFQPLRPYMSLMLN